MPVWSLGYSPAWRWRRPVGSLGASDPTELRWGLPHLVELEPCMAWS